jgi:hypothetical protein
VGGGRRPAAQLRAPGPLRCARPGGRPAARTPGALGALATPRLGPRSSAAPCPSHHSPPHPLYQVRPPPKIETLEERRHFAALQAAMMAFESKMGTGSGVRMGRARRG